MANRREQFRRELLETALRNTPLNAALGDPTRPTQAVLVADAEDAEGYRFLVALCRIERTPRHVREACTHVLHMRSIMATTIPIDLILQIADQSHPSVAKAVRRSSDKGMIPSVVIAADGTMTCGLASPRHLAETN